MSGWVDEIGGHELDFHMKVFRKFQIVGMTKGGGVIRCPHSFTTPILNLSALI
jgi:hypothetical protein